MSAMNLRPAEAKPPACLLPADAAPADVATEAKAAAANANDDESMYRAKPGEHLKTKVDLSKLKTHEDPYHIHKTLGVLSLLSFAYRYFWVLPTTGTLGFEGSTFDWVNMCVHLALSTSSIMFHVVKARMLRRPMIMWEEYRLHAIVFSLRCFVVYSVGAAFRHGSLPFLGMAPNSLPDENSALGRAIIFTAVMANHVLADYITSLHGTPGVTSVRVAVSKNTGKVKYSAVKKFYSFYQFLAVGSHLLPHARTMDLGYNSLIAIQSSAFLMTLCRKNIITFRTHGLVYSICLFLSAGYILRTFVPTHGVAFVLAAFAVFQTRVALRANKYVLWATFASLATPEISEVVSRRVQEAVSTGVTVAGACVGAYGGSYSWLLAPGTVLACFGGLAYANAESGGGAERAGLATARKIVRVLRGGSGAEGKEGEAKIKLSAQGS